MIEKLGLVLLICGIAAVPDPAGEPDRGFRLQVGARKDPWTLTERMLALDLTLFGSQAERSGTDAQKFRRLREIHPTFGLLSVSIKAEDLITTAERGDEFSSPTIA